MIIKIIKYVAVFVLGAMTMASNPDVYDKARVFFNGVDDVVQNITQKEQEKPTPDEDEDEDE